MENKKRRYAFSWDLLGTDIEGHRPNMGGDAPLEVYRLFQFTLRDVLEKHYGADTADSLFREAGVIAGTEFFKKYCGDVKDAPDLAKRIQERFRDLSIGIVRFEKIDLENMTFQLTVDEDLDCSGLPDTKDHICSYDEGLIKGILDAFTGKRFSVEEVDCWCSGDRTCRFKAKLV